MMKKMNPNTVHPANAIYDGPDNDAGDHGNSNKNKNTNAITEPTIANVL